MRWLPRLRRSITETEPSIGILHSHIGLYCFPFPTHPGEAFAYTLDRCRGRRPGQELDLD
jgi:hypothetical protein